MGAPTHARPILPGSAIGVFGSGQLGRMLGLAARAMGYRLHTFSPDCDSPAGQVAEREVSASYADLEAVREFVRQVDVVTFEFENVAPEVAEVALEEGVPVRPGGWVLHTAQERLREKHFLASAGLPVTPFQAVERRENLPHALEQVGTPAILKAAAFGYDGKGQARIDAPEQAEVAWTEIGEQPAILESHVAFQHELSVVAARGTNGEFAHYGAVENIHSDHILDLSIAPARVEPAVADQAAGLAHAVMEQMDVIGVLCVEFFLTAEGRLLVNEIAPRPHNSGHWTIDAAVTSQFEQQLRAVCGLPLGSTRLKCPAVMANLLGDLWQGGTPNWPAACSFPDVKLHLYGKRQPRPGRKMGHLTALAGDIDQALHLVQEARDALIRV